MDNKRQNNKADSLTIGRNTVDWIFFINLYKKRLRKGSFMPYSWTWERHTISEQTGIVGGTKILWLGTQLTGRSECCRFKNELKKKDKHMK